MTIILALVWAGHFLMCAILGPAAFELGDLGLSGWAARLPFYLLRLYIGPAVLLTRGSADWYMTGPLLGAALGALEYGAGMPGPRRRGST